MYKQGYVRRGIFLNYIKDDEDRLRQRTLSVLCSLMNEARVAHSLVSLCLPPSMPAWDHSIVLHCCTPATSEL